MVTWNDIQDEFEAIKSEFDRVYKCLNKKQKLSEDTENKHKFNIIDQYNTLIIIYNNNYKLLRAEHILFLENELFVLRDRLLNLFTKLKFNISIPYSIKELINVDKQSPFFEEILNFDIDIVDMATKKDFIKDNGKLIPEFNGDIDDLQRFIDALTLVKEDVGNHEVTAVQLIKTKLSGKARTCIDDRDNTIDRVIDKLKLSVKGETSEVLMGRLMNLKQNSKSASAYTEDIVKLVDSLKTAYIEEGLTYDIADKFATKEAIRAMQKNGNSDDVKFVMKAGNFVDMNEAISKFIAVSNDQSAKPVMYMNMNRNFRGRGKPDFKFRQNNYNNRFNSNARNDSRSFYNNSYNGNRSFRGRNNFHRNDNQRFFRNNRNNWNSNNGNNPNSGNRQVRVIDEDQDQGNSVNPQFVRLGEIK